MRRHSLIKIFLLVFVIMVLSLKLLVPLGLCAYINYQLAEDPEYSGSVQRVALVLLRPGIILSGIHIEDRVTQDQSLLDVKNIEAYLKLKSLLRGKIQTQVHFDALKLTFMTLAPKPGAKPPTYIWQVLRQTLLPLPIDEISIAAGQVHYLDKTTNPPFKIAMADIEAQLIHLQTPSNAQNPLPAHLHLEATTLGAAALNTDIAFDPKAPSPTFQTKFALRHLHLPDINDFLEAYTDLRATQGEFNLVVAAEAQHGHLQGYGKPFFQDVKLTLGPKDQDKALKHLYKNVVQWLAQILKNNDTQNTATKIDFSGHINDPDASLWQTIVNLLRNAFLEALLPRFD